VQRNVKRMLAYSSISHAGFVLLALWAASPSGTAAALYYLAAYSLLVIGSFAVVTVVAAQGREDLTSFQGLAASRPLLAASFTVLLLAQAGVPFTTGFLAKLAVIESAVEHLGAPGVALGVVAMLATAISGYFYLRVVVLMYARRAEVEPPTASVPPAPASVQSARLAAVGSGILLEDARDGVAVDHADGDEAVTSTDPAPVPLATAVAIALCVVPTVVLGVWAGPLVDLTSRATMLFHP